MHKNLNMLTLKILSIYVSIYIESTGISGFFIDGSNRAFVNLMKVAFSEPLSWESSKQGHNPEAWKVLPVNFATEHKQMLAKLHMF